MRRVVGARILQVFFATAAGAVVALGLRSEWSASLFVLFIGSVALLSYGLVVWPTEWPWHLMLALGFNAVASQGFLGPLDGAFGGVWLLLVVVYAVFYAGVVHLFAVAIRRIELRTVLCPFAIVMWEYLRHLAVRWHDGAGLTFCLLGQALANDDCLLQSVDIGGVWLLSFLCVGVGIAIASWATLDLSIRFRIRLTVSVAIGAASAIGYGLWRQKESAFDMARMTSLYVVYPDIPSPESLIVLNDWLEEWCSNNQQRDLAIVFPEACVAWNANSRAPEQAALLNLSKSLGATVVAGAWLPMDEGRNRNVCLILRDGVVQVVVDKLHLVTGVESNPIGTRALIRLGLIPPAAVRDVASVDLKDYSPWASGRLSIHPSVCYDMFFSDTFRRYGPSHKKCPIGVAGESLGVI